MEYFLQKRILALLFLLSNQVFGFNSTDDATYAFSELLYWKVSEIGADNWAQVITPPDANQSIQFLSVPFKWNPGFRVGLGHQTKKKHWDTVIYYTWYQTPGSNQASVSTGEIHSANLGNFYANNVTGDGLSGPYYHNAGIQWNVLFNSLDGELGHTFTIKEQYNFRPFVGLKAALINQSIHTLWQNPYDPAFKIPITSFSSATEQITNNFWGIGPSVGLNSSWHLYETDKSSVDLSGDFSGALLWGNWHFRDIYHNDTPVTISVQSDPLSTTASMARGRLGLGWQGTIHNLNVIFRVSYEGQIWLNQLRYYSFDAGRQNNALYMQGGVLDFCIYS